MVIIKKTLSKTRAKEQWATRTDYSEITSRNSTCLNNGGKWKRLFGGPVHLRRPLSLPTASAREWLLPRLWRKEWAGCSHDTMWETPQASLLQAPVLLIKTVLKEQEGAKSSKGWGEVTSHNNAWEPWTAVVIGLVMVLSQKPGVKVFLVGSRGILNGMPLPVWKLAHASRIAGVW